MGFVTSAIVIGSITISAAVANAVIIAVIAAVISMVLGIIMAPGGGGSQGAAPPKDEGVKQRVPTDPQNKMTIVYGERKQQGTITMGDISSDDQTMFFILTLCEGPCERINEIYWADKLLSFNGNINTGLRSVTNAKENNGEGDNNEFLNANLRLQAFPQGGRCTPMEDNSSRWRNNAANRTMPDTCYVYIEVDYNREDRVTGLEQRIAFYVSGRRIKTINSNSRTAYENSTPVYSTNPAECLLDYLTDTNYGCSISLDDIDVDTFYSHKRFCGELLPYTDNSGNTQTAPRYSCNGSLSTKTELDMNISELTNNNGGWFTYNLGRFGVVSDATVTKRANSTINNNNADEGIQQGLQYIISSIGVNGTFTSFGASNSPEVGEVFVATRSTNGGDSAFTGLAEQIVGVFSEENMFGRLSITSAGFENIVNQLTIKWASNLQAQQEEDQLILTIDPSTAIRNFNEPLLEKTLGLTMTRTNIEAERLGSILLNNSRQNIVVDMQIDISNIELQAGDIIGIRHATPGWGYEGADFDLQNPVAVPPKLFRVVYIEEEVTDNNISLRVSAQEYANEIYDDRVIQEIDVAPNTNFSSANRAPDIGSNIVRAKNAEFSFTESGNSSSDTITVGVVRDDGNTVNTNITIAANSTAAQVATTVASVLSANNSVNSSSTIVQINNVVRVLFVSSTDVGDATLVISNAGSTGISVTAGDIRTPFDNASIAATDITRAVNGVASVGASISWRDVDPFLDRVEISWLPSSNFVDFNTLTPAQLLLAGSANSSNPSSLEILELDVETAYQIGVRGVSYLGTKSPFVTAVVTTGTSTTTSPINLTATEQLYNTNNAGGIKSRVLVTWANPSIEGQVNASSNLLEFKRSSDLDFTSYGNFSGTSAVINDLELVNNTTTLYDFRITSQSSLGVTAPPLTIDSIPVSGLTAAPAAPTGLSLNASTSQAIISWDKSTELDVLSGGSVQIRYHPSATAASWNTAQIIVGSLQGATTAKTINLLVGTYLIKFIDSTNNESDDAATITNSFAPTGFNFVTEIEESPTFAGVKSNCTVVTGNLDLDAGQTTMQYDFANTIDLNSVKAVRITPSFVANIFDRSDTICNTLVICNRSSFCSVQLDADIRLSISTSQDGTTFTSYNTLIAGDYSAQFFRFRIEATAGDTNTLIQFAEIGVDIDAVDVIQTGTVTTTTTGAAATQTFPTAFYAGIGGLTVPRLGTQVIGGSEGDVILITNRTATGFTVEAFDNTSTGTRVIRDIDWQAIGQ